MKIKNTTLQLARQVECAKQVGIYDQMFLSFGALLGYIRHDGMIPGDDDWDVGILGDNVSIEQQEEYIKLLEEPTDDFPEKGLFTYRKRLSRRLDNKYFWLSVRGKSVDDCFKCCNWFFWEKHGYMWHSKGKGSLVKGAPKDYFEIGEEIDFLGVKIRVPKMTGALLDLWYPEWATQRMGGNSSKKILLKNVNWETLCGDVEE